VFNNRKVAGVERISIVPATPATLATPSSVSPF